MQANDGVHTNTKLKDTLFRKLFGEDKEVALSLYNAVNGTSYSDPEDLEFTMLEDVIFYNGEKDAEDREVLKLSSAFEDPSAGSEYEWTATMLNITS